MEDAKSTAITAVQENQGVGISPFSTKMNFEEAWRMANCLSNSSLVPEQYQGKVNIPNCMIALEMAHRTGVSPFLIMQNMYVIHGKPSMSSQYLIAMVNASGKFSPLRWKVEKRGQKKFNNGPTLEDCTYTAFATELATGETLEGPEVTTDMAVREGWYGKNGSKWATMPDLMFRYRAAAFFSRMYCPEMAMGLKTTDELNDITEDVVPQAPSARAVAKKLTEELAADDEQDCDVQEAQLCQDAKQEETPRPNSPEDLGFGGAVEEKGASERPKKQKEALRTSGQANIDFAGKAPGDEAFEFPEERQPVPDNGVPGSEDGELF